MSDSTMSDPISCPHPAFARLVVVPRAVRFAPEVEQLVENLVPAPVAWCRLCGSLPRGGVDRAGEPRASRVGVQALRRLQRRCERVPDRVPELRGSVRHGGYVTNHRETAKKLINTAADPRTPENERVAAMVKAVKLIGSTTSSRARSTR